MFGFYFKSISFSLYFSWDNFNEKLYRHVDCAQRNSNGYLYDDNTITKREIAMTLICDNKLFTNFGSDSDFRV